MKASHNETVIRPDLRFRFNSTVTKSSLLVVLPLALYVSLQLFRQGFFSSMIILGMVAIILIVGYIWLRFGHKVILGQDYVEVQWGFRKKTFHSSPAPAVVVLNQMPAALTTTADPLTGWVFIRQGKLRASAAYMNSADQAKILKTLGNPKVYKSMTLPSGGLLEKPTGEYAKALPTWLAHPWRYGLMIAGIIMVFVTVFALIMVNQANKDYRQAAAGRLEQSAARYTGQDWQPKSAPDIHWTDNSDHSSLSYDRTYTVPYKNNEEFVAGWQKITGQSVPLNGSMCSKTPDGYFSCYANAHEYVNGTEVRITGNYSYLISGDPDATSAPKVEMTFEDVRGE